MSPRLVVGIAIALPVLLAVAGCGGDREPLSKASAAPERLSALGQAVPADARRCPVTLPSRKALPGESLRGFNYGNGELWTGLWPYGAIVADSGFVHEDGAVGMKIPWWRGVEGELTIEGRRLDGAASPLRAEIPKGYGPTGFQPSGIIFPTEGCWQVTGKAGGAALTFVTLVIKASTLGLEW